MIFYTNKIQILFYIRQAGEIGILDLYKKLFPKRDILRDTEGRIFLEHIADLYNADLIKITNIDSSVSFDESDVEKSEVTHILYFALRSYSLRKATEINLNNILVSLTEQFEIMQQKIGFSLSDEMNYQQEESGRYLIFGEVEPTLKSKVFVIMPFTTELKPVYEEHIKPICKKLDYSCTRVDLIDRPNVIINDIWSLINNSDIIICDCTGKNPNVFYELGLAHSLGKKVICITQNADDIPFDIEHIRYIKYNPRSMKEFEVKLEEYLSKIILV